MHLHTSHQAQRIPITVIMSTKQLYWMQRTVLDLFSPSWLVFAVPYASRSSGVLRCPVRTPYGTVKLVAHVSLDSCRITGRLFFVAMPRRSAVTLSDSRTEPEEALTAPRACALQEVLGL